MSLCLDEFSRILVVFLIHSASCFHWIRLELVVSDLVAVETVAVEVMGLERVA